LTTELFRDYFRIVRHDDDSSVDEDRCQTIGFYDNMLFVVYTERESGDIIRIISARIAEQFERRIYANSKTLYGGWERVNPKRREEARIRLQEAASRPYVYDPDCPLLTEEQLAQFKPVNFATMEERAEAMKAAGIIIDVDEREPALA
jgi:uncharacterized DUF497 family protein